MKGHTMTFVKFTDEVANLRPHDAFERLALRRHYVYGDSPGAQRRRNFQSDKAGAHHYYTFCGCRPGNDRLAVAECTEIVDLRIGRAFNRQMDWLRSGCQQESAKFKCLSIFEHYLPPLCIQGRNSGAEEEINTVVAIIVSRSKRNPFFLRRACEVVLGKVRTIHWRRVVGTYDGKSTVVALTPQHVGRSQTSSSSAHNHNRAGTLAPSLGGLW